jgi:predicted nucleotidyltransferase/HEPN domain-containing protein
MKHTLNKLPQIKQDELQRIVEIICQNCDTIEKIILFGSYARGNYKEAKDLKKDRKSGHISDYDILAITKTKEVALNKTLWNQISKLCRNLKLSADPRIITHDIQALNIKLAEGQYFYKDTKEEGTILYDSGNFELADERELTGKEKQRIAQDHFSEWFKSAEGFLRHYNYAMKDKDCRKSAFNLHQTTESAYKTIHLVFTNYCPNEHMLEYLGNKAAEFHPEIEKLFAQNNREDEDRFELFEYAYIGGRYDPEYYISAEDLEILAKDVEKLLKITEEICQKKIKDFD